MTRKIDRRNFMKLATGNDEGNVVLPESRSNIQDGKKPLRLGFIGIGGRGSYHLNCALGIEGIEVPAICELKPVRLHQAKRWIEEAGLPTPRMYDRGPEDYRRLLEEEELDAIICCTPWEFHTPVCVTAMKNGKHAVSEVPICITLDEAWELVETYEKTGKWATIGLEGMGDQTLINMIRKGLFGEIVHAQTGYIHDLRMVKFTPGEEPWRLQHSIERNGNLYPDHPMARMLPVLDINHGDRFDYIQSMSTDSVMLRNYAELNYGKKSPYSNMKYSLGDYNASLIRTVNGKIMTIIHDTSTPHPRENFRMQGTKGIYYSDERRIYIDGLSPEPHTWESADKYFKQYEVPRQVIPARKGGTIEGHGGGGSQTPLVWHRLVTALRENRLPDWDVYDSVTSSSIVPLSCESVANKSKAVDFPDFTKGKWKDRAKIMPQV
ncbi:MAG TPA: Gfo/Idh/MocA family oxidoreductase [Bacteroidales bacterium]|nr:Gfo/Idh/MocA family oxidoreductase [Bacteroidales bacterium]